ncbi:MAG: HD domain-containing protein [Lewinellaceae bacterium]|nr:HD domain-containing protein [Saprospiraceae bacterium]MCB9343762.1 HD domain-containing protein [Lewinellaceae bacterium]
MIRPSIGANKLESLLQPETGLERALLMDTSFQKGLLWGLPRFGHPEGTVALHVREVLDNINLISGLSSENRQALRLIALAHDTFKYLEDRSRPRDWSKHHGLLARRFMEDYTSDKLVLDIIETHDDAYYTWLAERRNSSSRNLSGLLDRIGYCLQLYYLFFKCDTQTGDKTQAPLRWFEQKKLPFDQVKIKDYWPWEKD